MVSRRGYSTLWCGLREEGVEVAELRFSIRRLDAGVMREEIHPPQHLMPIRLLSDYIWGSTAPQCGAKATKLPFPRGGTPLPSLSMILFHSISLTCLYPQVAIPLLSRGVLGPLAELTGSMEDRQAQQSRGWDRERARE